MGIKTIQSSAAQSTKRSLIFSDTTWAGSGSMSAGLITNLNRTYTDMKNSIAMAMGLSMYGISNTVVDVCGSKGPLDEEL